MNCILAWPSDPELASTTAASRLSGLSVVACGSADEFEDRFDRMQVKCVVLDPIATAEWLRSSHARSVLNSTPVVLRTTLSPRTARLIAELASIVAIGRVSLVGTASVEFDVASILNNSTPHCADGALLRSQISGLPVTLRQALIGAVSIGHRRTTVAELARACRVPTRTLQWQLSQAGGAAASDLLAWCLALHCLWRLDVLGWSLKRCTVIANFDDSGAMATFIQRHVGRRPSGLVADGGFDSLRQRWLEHLGVATQQAV